MFIDQRYVVLRDRVELGTPAKISWLLHAEKNLSWDDEKDSKVALAALIVSPEHKWHGNVTDQFPVPVDSKYGSGEVGSNYVTGKWTNQRHLTLESTEAEKSFAIFAVLWPEKGTNKPTLSAKLEVKELLVSRPDGKTDHLSITDDGVKIE